MASYKKGNLCAKAAPPRYAPSPKGLVFVTKALSQGDISAAGTTGKGVLSIVAGSAWLPFRPKTPGLRRPGLRHRVSK